MRRLIKCMILYYWNQVTLNMLQQKKMLKIYSKWNYQIYHWKQKMSWRHLKKKLTSNKEFRTKLVAELKRFSRSTLPSTVRIIMRQMFKDALLEKFSYKGLKKKKVFYTLATCTVFFDAIKQMKKLKLSDAVDIETPIRTFISGAKFREPKKNLLITSNNELS